MLFCLFFSCVCVYVCVSVAGLGYDMDIGFVGRVEIRVAVGGEPGNRKSKKKTKSLIFQQQEEDGNK